MRRWFSSSNLTKVLIALGSGYLGGLANVISITFLNGLSGNLVLDNQFVYKQVAWGSLWAVLYAVGIFERNWKLKGLLVSTIATIFTFFVFQTLFVSIETVLRSFIVNVLVWGGVSSFLYHKALMNVSKYKINVDL